jgi:hypothetical protein
MKIAKRLMELAYAYANEINNYQEDHLVVRMVDAHTMLIEVRTEYEWDVCGAYVPINELPYRMVKRVIAMCEKGMGWFTLDSSNYIIIN